MIWYILYNFETYKNHYTGVRKYFRCLTRSLSCKKIKSKLYLKILGTVKTIIVRLKQKYVLLKLLVQQQ